MNHVDPYLVVDEQPTRYVIYDDATSLKENLETLLILLNLHGSSK